PVRILLPQSLKTALETTVNPREKAGPLLRLGVLVLFHLGAQQVHGERRNQCPGEEVGSDQREYDGFGQRYEEVAGHTRQEEHRYEHDADAEGGNKSGNRDLCRSIQNARVEVL